MLCPHCRRTIPSEAVFCGACGKRVIGWKGTPRGGPPRETADSKEDTKPVRPDSGLIRAAGGDPAATRRIPADSDLLRAVRGESEITRSVRPDSSLIRASRGEDPRPPAPEGDAPYVASPGPGLPGLRGRADAPTSYPGDTAFMMEEALHRRRSRLALLMIADACLLAVGIYLIVSWATRPSRPPARASTPAPGGRGYVSWEEDGQPGRIATGPVKASFTGMEPGESAAPPRMAPEPMRPTPTRPTPDSRPAHGMARPRPATMDPPPRPKDTMAAARERRIASARKAFLARVPQRIRSRRKEIRRCYEQTLKLLGKVGGYVDISFVVSVSGTVDSAVVTRNTTGSKTLGSCISGVFLSTTFPRPPGGAVSLRFPFHFSARK